MASPSQSHQSSLFLGTLSWTPDCYGSSIFATQDGSLGLTSSHRSRSLLSTSALNVWWLQTQPYKFRAVRGTSHHNARPVTGECFEITNSRVQNSHFSSLSDGLHAGNYSSLQILIFPPAPRGCWCYIQNSKKLPSHWQRVFLAEVRRGATLLDSTINKPSFAICLVNFLQAPALSMFKTIPKSHTQVPGSVSKHGWQG